MPNTDIDPNESEVTRDFVADLEQQEWAEDFEPNEFQIGRINLLLNRYCNNNSRLEELRNQDAARPQRVLNAFAEKSNALSDVWARACENNRVKGYLIDAFMQANAGYSEEAAIHALNTLDAIAVTAKLILKGENEARKRGELPLPRQGAPSKDEWRDTLISDLLKIARDLVADDNELDMASRPTASKPPPRTSASNAYEIVRDVLKLVGVELTVKALRNIAPVPENSSPAPGKPLS